MALVAHTVERSAAAHRDRDEHRADGELLGVQPAHPHEVVDAGAHRVERQVAAGGDLAERVRRGVEGREHRRQGPDGRLTNKPQNVAGDYLDQSRCNAERMYLSQINDDMYFREILGEANRANATFYTVDPRGLPVFDTGIEAGCLSQADHDLFEEVVTLKKLELSVVVVRIVAEVDVDRIFRLDLRLSGLDNQFRGRLIYRRLLVHVQGSCGRSKDGDSQNDRNSLLNYVEILLNRAATLAYLIVVKSRIRSGILGLRCAQVERFRQGG